MSPLAAEIFEVRICFRCPIPLSHFYMLPLPIFIHKTVKGGFFLLLSALVGALSWSVVVLHSANYLPLHHPDQLFSQAKPRSTPTVFATFLNDITNDLKRKKKYFVAFT